jgi:NADH:ubiquinone oxidoreductase subunit D
MTSRWVLKNGAKNSSTTSNPNLSELETVLIENEIFVQRTANVGVLPLDLAINYGVTGPMLRASGLRFDLRKVDGYSVYPELEFNIPIGEGKKGTVPVTAGTGLGYGCRKSMNRSRS